LSLSSDRFSSPLRSLIFGAVITLVALPLQGVAAPSAVTLNWQTLKTLTSPTVKDVPIRQYDGKMVSIPGFMVPLEDDAETVTEFLLVPYAGACIHVPPPPPNQMVHVLMNRSAKVKMSFTDPIVVIGTLKISTVQSPYGSVSYDLAADQVSPYTGGS
jgi:hypothetical protein